ncbi:hypothetical protein N7478_007910 [Penicillium angulare]|uniref:uncharacterized protein n=1 Tax=Penicillium angulare TaxID=116970 RepID=UPI0025417926|nr:uncharacterized protein N7478_007910 [Penicillium angulare]KAJ5272785.1 hypothetical protein N7478_007910 [Penicillium angulare]
MRKAKQNKLSRVEALERSGQMDYAVDSRGLHLGSLSAYREGKLDSKDVMMDKFQRVSKFQYDAGIRDGFIPRAISEKTFHEVGTKLISAAWTNPPNGHSIRAISTDVDAMVRLGFMISIDQPELRGWIVSSCALARSAWAVVTLARRQITDTSLPTGPQGNSWLQENEKLSDEGYPAAMLLHAKVLSLKGKFHEALELLENGVLPHLKASSRRAPTFEDITLGGILDSPYRLYAVVQATLGEHYDSKKYRDGADEALKIAAVEYNDVQALVEYGGLMMNQNKLGLYEECMSKAASGGDAKACLFLANYYYLTYLGVYPTHGEQKPTKKNPDPLATWKPIIPTREAKATELTTWGPRYYLSTLKKMVNISTSRPEYYTLARDWYALAYEHGEGGAAFMSALMDRELGLLHNGRVYLEKSQMQHDPLFQKKMEELKANWYDSAYEPSVSRKMLPVQ